MRFWRHYLVQWLAMCVLASGTGIKGDPVAARQRDLETRRRLDRQLPFWSYTWHDEQSGRIISCWKCLPGDFVDQHCREGAPDSTRCAPCPDRTYTGEPNSLEQCLPCSWCPNFDDYYMAASCKRDRDTVCRCQGRMYKHGDVCNHCNPGYEGTEAVDDGPCRRCPVGTFSYPSRGQETCQPHTNCVALGQAVAQAGTDRTDATCAPVPTTAPPVTPSAKETGTPSGPRSMTNNSSTTIEKSAAPPRPHSTPSREHDNSQLGVHPYNALALVILGFILILLFFIVVILVWRFRDDILGKITAVRLSSQEKDVYTYISKKLGSDWKQMAREIESLNDADIDTIDKSPDNIQDKTHAMLIKWKRNLRDKATLSKLVVALNNIQRRDLAEYILEQCPEADTFMGSNAALI